MKTVDEKINAVFLHWVETFQKKRARLDDKRKKIISAALNIKPVGYSVDDLKTAIDGVRNTPHNMGFNDRQTMYIDIGLIFRDADHIDRYMSKAPKSNGQKSGALDRTEERIIADPIVRKKALETLRAMAKWR